MVSNRHHQNKALPLLYSFRRCPYAIRARLALRLANIDIDIIEVKLSNKPQSMLALSAKGTVPVLHLISNGQVIDESLDIISWSCEQSSHTMFWDPHHKLLKQNDTSFKKHLDCYKYFEKHPEQSQIAHRQACFDFLSTLEDCLAVSPFLIDKHVSLIDVAVMPFIRQFSKVDDAWWQQQTPFSHLKRWLNDWLDNKVFKHIMRQCND